MKELQPWELTPEEKITACNKAWEDICDGKSSADFLADAAVKKVVEWIGEVGTDDGIAWCIFNTDWAELKQEVGL